MNKNKCIRTKVYEFYEPENDKMDAPMTLNIYLADIHSVAEAKNPNDAVIGAGGQLLIIKYPYKTLLKEWKAFKEQQS